MGGIKVIGGLYNYGFRRLSRFYPIKLLSIIVSPPGRNIENARYRLLEIHRNTYIFAVLFCPFRELSITYRFHCVSKIIIIKKKYKLFKIKARLDVKCFKIINAFHCQRSLIQYQTTAVFNVE